MIDRPARQSLAQLVRQFGAGSISTDEFACDARTIADGSDDVGVQAVYCAADSLHDDFSPFWSDRFRGRDRLAPEIRRRIAIATLFLQSDVEYEWPPDDRNVAWLDSLLLLLCAFSALVGLILSAVFPLSAVCLLTLAVTVFCFSRWLLNRHNSQWVDRQNQIGDFDVWPFLRRQDFDRARQQPRVTFGGAR